MIVGWGRAFLFVFLGLPVMTQSYAPIRDDVVFLQEHLLGILTLSSLFWRILPAFWILLIRREILSLILT